MSFVMCYILLTIFNLFNKIGSSDNQISESFFLFSFVFSTFSLNSIQLITTNIYCSVVEGWGYHIVKCGWEVGKVWVCRASHRKKCGFQRKVWGWERKRVYCHQRKSVDYHPPGKCGLP